MSLSTVLGMQTMATEIPLAAISPWMAEAARRVPMPPIMRERLLAGDGPPEPGVPAPNEREAASLAAARQELADLLTDIRAGLPYDLLGVRLETACRLLGDITGESTPDEVLAAVFDRFCIGK